MIFSTTYISKIFKTFIGGVDVETANPVKVFFIHNRVFEIAFSPNALYQPIDSESKSEVILMWLSNILYKNGLKKRGQCQTHDRNPRP